ncbi:MAG: DUF4317 family protein [Mogibacterium sp.]|nr:DUF4317 family protein [Mogibacterium sp.]
MTPEDIRRIRKRIDSTLENFSSIYGCYVNGAGDTVAEMEIPVLGMDTEEKEMYAATLKKVLSGTQERNLIDIEFTPDQVDNSDEHRLLMALKDASLKDPNMRELLYQRIKESFHNDGDSYVILLASDTYDLKTKDVRGEEWSEESVEQFTYFICAICPVKSSKAALQYDAEEQEFRGISTGTLLAAPALGFMFPVLDDGGADIYRVSYYSKSSSDIHDELIEALFASEQLPMAADVQKEAFNTSLADALGKECSLDLVTALQAMMYVIAEESKDDETVTVPVIALEDVEDILADRGVSEEGIGEFRKTVEERFDGAPVFNINNIIQKKKFEVKTPETRIVTEADNALRLKTKTIDGVTYILVPVGETVTVNGVEIAVEFDEE